MDFNIAFERLIQREGGYADDPFDRGGRTKYGISQAAYPTLDIANLTIEDAREIYYDDYWRAGRVEMLPEELWETFFDMCVNHGIYGATVILQRAINATVKSKIAVDGILGNITAGAATYLDVDRLRSERMLFYSDIVRKRPGQRRFWFGWYRRAISV